MAIDTAQKRRSVAGVSRKWRAPGQTPDAEKGLSWRLAAGRQYTKEFVPPIGEIHDIEVAMAKELHESPPIQQLVGTRIYSNRAPQSVDETPVGETYLVISRTDTQSEYILRNQYTRIRTTLRVEIWQQDVDRTSSHKLRMLARYIRSRFSGDFGDWAGIAVQACVLQSEDDFIERPKEGSDAWWFARRLDFAVVHEISEPRHR